MVRALRVTALSMSTACDSKSDSSKPASAKGPSAQGRPGTEATITITDAPETAPLTHAGRVSLSDGADYTVLLTDSEVDSRKISMMQAPDPVKVHHLVTIFIAVFNPEEHATGDHRGNQDSLHLRLRGAHLPRHGRLGRTSPTTVPRLSTAPSR